MCVDRAAFIIVSIQLFAPINGDIVLSGLLITWLVGFHSIVCPHQWRRSSLELQCQDLRDVEVSIQLFAPINGDASAFFWSVGCL